MECGMENRMCMETNGGGQGYGWDLDGGGDGFAGQTGLLYIKHTSHT